MKPISLFLPGCKYHHIPEIINQSGEDLQKAESFRGSSTSESAEASDWLLTTQSVICASNLQFFGCAAFIKQSGECEFAAIIVIVVAAWSTGKPSLAPPPHEMMFTRCSACTLKSALVSLEGGNQIDMGARSCTK